MHGFLYKMWSGDPRGGVCRFCVSAPPSPGNAGNFFTSLFDFTLKETITPLIIRILYVIGVIGIAIGALAALISVIQVGNYMPPEWILLALISIPIGAFIVLISLRLYLEFIMVFFNIYGRLGEMQRTLGQVHFVV